MAHDEWHQLDTLKPDWKTQGSFTVRFSNVLTSAELDAIHERILREARMHRHIHETLARNAPSDRVVISIDTLTLNNTDPSALRQLLLNSGMTFVSSGYGKQVLEWFSLLNSDAAKEPRIQLVAAFAESSLGRYHAAIGHLAAAMLSRPQLSSVDQQFLVFLRAACDYNTGRITLDDFVIREREWADRLTGIQAAEHRLEVLRRTRLVEHDADRRTRLLQQMHTTVDEILADGAAVPAQKLQAQIVLLLAEGDDLNSRLIEATSFLNFRYEASLLTASMSHQATQDAANRLAEWKVKCGPIRDQAVELGHPLLIADAIAARVTVLTCVLIGLRLASIGRGTDELPPRQFVDELLTEAAQAIQVYGLAGAVEGEVRVKLLVADLHDLAGDSDKAKAIAGNVLPIAEAMSYGPLQVSAREHVEGKSILSIFAVRVEERRPRDQDTLLAVESDSNIRSMAKMLLASSMAPAERIGMAEKECFTMRQIARERVQWCRYLDLISDERDSRTLRQRSSRNPNVIAHATSTATNRRSCNAIQTP